MSGILDFSLVISACLNAHLHHNGIAHEPQTNWLIRISVTRANLVGDHAGRRSLNSKKKKKEKKQNSQAITKPVE